MARPQRFGKSLLMAQVLYFFCT
ncbi:MAG: hypothetical protein IJ165_14470 [Proteobacteria bacterium]|nr:hypothetical protein [Pseudomonadota bacterium]